MCIRDRVRTLAGRSAAAAKEIKALINESGARVADGGRLVDQAGASLGGIAASIQRVTDVVAEIALASKEQAAGIEQVSKAVTLMDDMTQQNAALVEQAAAASETIVGQVGSLSERVGRYDVGAAAMVANVADRPRVPRASAPVQVERRSVARPWAGRSKPAAAASRDAAPSRGAANSAAADWEEF